MAPVGSGDGADGLTVLSERQGDDKFRVQWEHTANSPFVSYVGHFEPNLNQTQEKAKIFFSFLTRVAPKTMTHRPPCRRHAPPFSTTLTCLRWDLSSHSPSCLTMFCF